MTRDEFKKRWLDMTIDQFNERWNTHDLYVRRNHKKFILYKYYMHEPHDPSDKSGNMIIAITDDNGHIICINDTPLSFDSTLACRGDFEAVIETEIGVKQGFNCWMLI